MTLVVEDVDVDVYAKADVVVDFDADAIEASMVASQY